ncbi:MAG: protein kinase [Myxococcota bacterium]
MDPAANQEPVRALGRYELLFRIASGGMAEVYAARVRGEAGFQKLVAVKRMLPQLADDEEFVTMFLDEARVAAHINSPNCVATQDLGRADDGSLYIVMELVVGVTLARILKWSVRARQPIPVGLAVELLGQAAHGLHDAHVATTPLGAPLQIVHRDVSPQNVLVGVDGRVRLTDFGVARAVLRVTQTQAGRIKGKFAYCSPEQLSGKGVDQRSDVFSLGVVAWELFAGQRLFVAEHPLETMDRVRSMPIPAVSQIRGDVPEAVSNVVAAALSRDLDKRIPTAHEFDERIRAAAQDAGIPIPERSHLTRFIQAAGGESLHKVRENIKLALSNRGETGPPIGAAGEPEQVLTPSGVQPSIQTVDDEASDPTDPTTGAHQPRSPDADASVPSLAAHPSSLLPPSEPVPELAPPRKNGALVAIAAALGLVAVVAAIAVVATSDDPAPAEPISTPPSAAQPAAGDPAATLDPDGTGDHSPSHAAPDREDGDRAATPRAENAGTETGEGEAGAHDRVIEGAVTERAEREGVEREGVETEGAETDRAGTNGSENLPDEGRAAEAARRARLAQQRRERRQRAQPSNPAERGASRMEGARRGSTGLVTSGSIDWGN